MSDVRTGEGGGKEFQRVFGALRDRLLGGTYGVGSLLPTQRELADEFGVSRDTVQRALKILAKQGWIESRQGSGSRVLKTPTAASSAARSGHPGRITLGPFLNAAFEKPEVTLDVFTLTSETLDAHVRVQAERVRAGLITPRRISVRMLLPAEQIDLPYPQVKADTRDKRLQTRLRDITGRATASLRSVLRELETEDLVESVDMVIRHVPLVPPFKLYLLNGTEALHGPYEVIERRILLDSGEGVDALDVLGFGSTLTHFVVDAEADSHGSVFVASMQAWFNSCWNLLAEDP
ncbi:winged helix-turn-helix domain-containing protein [Streptomyces sp. E11-3]|uniref:winged helix-turn-helix domain-containing protein n=1 Tax=Streptomyces sp. E11-3 TaxID=3110112 RepID=UPI00398172C1